MAFKRGSKDWGSSQVLHDGRPTTEPASTPGGGRCEFRTTQEQTHAGRGGQEDRKTIYHLNESRLKNRALPKEKTTIYLLQNILG